VYFSFFADGKLDLSAKILDILGVTPDETEKFMKIVEVWELGFIPGICQAMVTNADIRIQFTIVGKE
jgi:hypothetical protein